MLGISVRAVVIRQRNITIPFAVINGLSVRDPPQGRPGDVGSIRPRRPDVCITGRAVLDLARRRRAIQEAIPAPSAAVQHLRVGRAVATYPALEQHSALEQTVSKPVPHLPSVETCRLSRSMVDCRSIRARLLFRDCSNASRRRLLAWTTVPVAVAMANVLNPFMAYC